MSADTVKTVAMPVSRSSGNGNGNGNGAAGPRRQLSISVLRYNPQDPASVPHMQTYPLEEADGMTLFIALNEIREHQDASLQFDFVCRAGICGSCAMVINGRPTLACRTLTKNLGLEITLAPLPFFELIGDLSVNTGKWMRGMSERLEGWLHMKDADPDLRRLEEQMDPDLADKIYELDRCIECGCCVAGLRHCPDARGLRRRGRSQHAWRASASTRAIRAPTRITTTSSATTTACSAACRCWLATTSARRTCRSRRRSPSCAGRWWHRAGSSAAPRPERISRERSGSKGTADAAQHVECESGKCRHPRGKREVEKY